MPFKKDIIRELRNSIAKGQYKPGERLTETALSLRFNVSRTPVREALSQLEKEGFVEITPSAGARVVRLSQKNVSDIYDILIVLEGLASRLAASKLTDEQINKLEEYYFLIVRASSQKNMDLVPILNARFHWLIQESTQNSYLTDLEINFRRLVDRFTSIFVLIPEQWEATLREHRQIIDAFKGKNSALAEFVTKEHLEGAKQRLLKYLNEKEPKDHNDP
jgi:DNA-binding GntR family transcriptional regulator